MGTRSAIALPTGDVISLAWKGRYVHWDGYPEGVGQALVDIIARDGVEKAVTTLMQEHYGWSNLDPLQGADEPLGLGYHDGRFVIVPGYGKGYTTVAGQSKPDEWVSRAQDWGIEYFYVIEHDGLSGFSTYGDSPTFVFEAEHQVPMELEAFKALRDRVLASATYT